MAHLGYWKMRGLAQPIRLLLEYTETKYDEKLYERGPAPDFERSCWLKDKFNMGYDFPNLPYYKDENGTMVTQSMAIMRYIARKHGLCGKSDQEILQVDIIENQTTDFRLEYSNLCYDSNFKNLKEDYLEKAKISIEQFSQYLGDRKWFAGKDITYADFLMYEGLDVHRVMDPTCLEGSENLTLFLERFEALPQIKEYMSSPRFIKAPLNDRQAFYGDK